MRLWIWSKVEHVLVSVVKIGGLTEPIARFNLSSAF